MRRGLATLLVLVLWGAVVPQVDARPRSTESYTYVEDDSLDHWLFTPAGRAPRPGRPMVVYLHGCTQRNETDPQVGFGTRWNEVAREVGAVVLYPLQDPYDMAHPERVEGNGGSCWNWFLDQNHHRGGGEPAAIAELALRIAAANRVDPRQIYVMGTSAGASMANVVVTTYPDVFRAAAMLAGCGYAACSDITGRLAYDELRANELGPRPAIIFQGSGDMLSNVALGQDLLRQQIGTHDWADDGEYDGSVVRTSTEHHGDGTAVDPGDGQPCIGDHGNWPCAAGITGWETYPYTVDRYANGQGSTVVETWLIHGLNHNYPNGDYESTFTDPAGPDITRAAWNFFRSTA